ncbi:VOC family protein [Kribbella sp. CA-294648]|uniref:VOC family protein n=1 Tax=Kribbella sp. CA-294648 TaxID=3239948 RepID=UPI003D91CA34
MGLRIGALVVDARDPGRLARFWAEALDWVISQAEDPEWIVEPPAGSREDCVVPDLLFIKVPEHKTIKNRLHLDLRPEDQATEVARLEALGATRVDVGQGDTQPWIVMADPEGNEFCVQNAHPPQIRAQWLKAYESHQPAPPDPGTPEQSPT